MNIHCLTAAPHPDLARALARFEQQFTYPLGPGRSFRITHGDDYPRFFRAMGEAACFVAERAGRVIGVIGVALRRLQSPDGAHRTVAYLGDLKIDPAVRGGRSLLQLSRAVIDWVGQRADAAFGVVMDGTRASPDAYTGRLGIPAFRRLGAVVVLRLAAIEPEGRDWLATPAEGHAAYARMCSGRYAGLGGFSAERSESAALWLVEPGGRACGRLEDTRLAKRLIADDGSEMRSAHLSCFGFVDPGAGAALLHRARQLAAARGFPALLVAVAEPETDALLRVLDDRDTTVAPATIHGAGLQPGPLWNIDTAEI